MPRRRKKNAHPSIVLARSKSVPERRAWSAPSPLRVARIAEPFSPRDLIPPASARAALLNCTAASNACTSIPRRALSAPNPFLNAWRKKTRATAVPSTPSAPRWRRIPPQPPRLLRRRHPLPASRRSVPAAPARPSTISSRNSSARACRRGHCRLSGSIPIARNCDIDFHRIAALALGMRIGDHHGGFFQ
jgi:hypothetical protein